MVILGGLMNTEITVTTYLDIIRKNLLFEENYFGLKTQQEYPLASDRRYFFIKETANLMGGSISWAFHRISMYV